MFERDASLALSDARFLNEGKSFLILQQSNVICVLCRVIFCVYFVSL